MQSCIDGAHLLNSLLNSMVFGVTIDLAYPGDYRTSLILL